MIGAISTALSGLFAASKRAEGSAQNIANISSSNYTPVATVQEAQESGGVSARNIPRQGAPNGVFSPEVNLSEEVVNLKVAELSYKANITAMKAAQDMAEESLRILDKKA